MKEIKKLPDSELEIMHVIWDAGDWVTSEYIRGVLKNTWAKTTLLNFLIRLSERGFVKCKKCGRINLYAPLIKREDYVKYEHKFLLKKFHKNSITDLVAALYDTEAITQEDLNELEEFIKGVK